MQMSDDNYLMAVCASCARQKRRCKLKPITFVRREADVCPSWMPWDVEMWKKRRSTWYEQLDDIFNVEKYLRRIFHIEERVASATMGEAAFEEGCDYPKEFESQAAARCWLKRVRRWVDNLRRDIRQDSVPAPGDGAQRWLLYPTSSLSQKANGDIDCLLCKRCFASLSHVDKSKEPAARMPPDARANGMWHGPDPAALQDLTYTEKLL